MRRSFWVLLFVVVLAPGSTGALAAQGANGSGILSRVDSFAHAGRTEEARGALLDWWERDRLTASRTDREHGAWLRALLTVDPEQARIEYRRLLVEFPGGRYAAPALARIARIAEASGDTTAARTAWEAILREHRGSVPARVAQEWIDEYAVDSDGETGQDAVEISDAPRTEPSGLAVETALDHAVQLGAFSSVVRARELFERARAAGLDPRLVTVPGSDLVRVRLGRFGSESQAEGPAERARSLGFDALIVDGSQREEEAGGR